ncbi:MAG: fibronectin type III domain-containing protein [Verrucomicrobiia bacterium]
MPIFDLHPLRKGEDFNPGPTNNAHWRQAGVTTHSSFTVKGLTSGTKHWFRVAANGTAGQGT